MEFDDIPPDKGGGILYSPNHHHNNDVMEFNASLTDSSQISNVVDSQFIGNGSNKSSNKIDNNSSSSEKRNKKILKYEVTDGGPFIVFIESNDENIGFYLPAIALIILGFVPSDQKNLAFALLIIAVATNAGNYIGFCVNHIDIAPNYAATLMGISNTFANVGSLIAPLVVQVIVVDEADETQWRIIFLIAAGFYIVTETLFIFMASGTIQAWNDPDEMNLQRTSKVIQA